MSTRSPDAVCIVGMGYVGLTLAAAFLAKGAWVYGIEAQESVRRQLQRGQIHLLEPGVDEIIHQCVSDSEDSRFQVSDEWPTQIKTAVICVGTPYDRVQSRPNLVALKLAVEQVAQRITDESLVVIRSTVPVGTTRSVVLPILRRHNRSPQLVVAPERTIQGKALEELLSLPQVIGADDAASFARAEALFSRLGTEVIRVSSYEAAELVKLACNAHTDVRYSFANEVAGVAAAVGLDAHEIIEAANHHYPRPPIARPGFVGGSCLTKDPYHLLYTAELSGYQPRLIAAARAVNESIPEMILQQVEHVLLQQQRSWSELKVTLSGLAYKGKPETDDLRGSILWELLPPLKARGVQHLQGHDFVLDDAVIGAHGLTPVTLAQAIETSDLVLILNDHRDYGMFALEEALSGEHQLLLYDLWGVYKQRIEHLKGSQHNGIHYMGVGFGG
ncbi:nucleotide sugar dehydrogenase [Brevibacillus humidisoli]|uniref:nucleotide sugar dehydrogenase n=1 Tax=Brevibacillus humidisoli TaxID=2895522 RepID=UPI001E5438B7|nr:nucleotide sugar dehydrogenase [Brevibacillus humidisoli]UFJ42437.1 nucleotide sugar dehydrogenase [Brevibacillus humidisoli]